MTAIPSHRSSLDRVVGALFEQVAIHEAGHAVAAHVLQLELVSVEIKALSGLVKSRSPRCAPGSVRTAVMSLAGAAAERHWCSVYRRGLDKLAKESAEDLAIANKAGERIVGMNRIKIDAVIDHCRSLAHELVSESTNWRAIETLAAMLMKNPWPHVSLVAYTITMA